MGSIHKARGDFVKCARDVPKTGPSSGWGCADTGAQEKSQRARVSDNHRCFWIEFMQDCFYFFVFADN